MLANIFQKQIERVLKILYLQSVYCALAKLHRKVLKFLFIEILELFF